MARIVFFGTPEIAVKPLLDLLEAGHDITLVVTRSDTRRGRGMKPSSSPVKRVAQEHGIRVTDHIEDVTDVDAEIGVVVAFGRIIPAHILRTIPMINIHFSLLPRWRGAAPVERAILAGDSVTGVCIMAVSEELDRGDVFASCEINIDDSDNLSALSSRLIDLGSSMLVSLLKGGVEGLPTPIPQVGSASYANKISVADLEINWQHSTAAIFRTILLERSWTLFRGKRLHIINAIEGNEPHAEVSNFAPGMIIFTDQKLLVRTGDSWLELLEVRPEGKNQMRASDWARGARVDPGEGLG